MVTKEPRTELVPGQARPVLRYPGSKARIAPWIVSHFPRHSAYLEPFFGSGAILFAKPRCEEETVNDIDGEVTTFFRVLRDQPEDLARLVALTPYARREQESCVERENISDIEAARRFLVRAWQTCGARLDDLSGFRTDRSGKSWTTKANVWADVPERLLMVADRLRGVQVETLPALELLRRHKAPAIFVYADPPYLGETRSPRMYQNEMMGEQEHLDLLAALDEHPGPVALSGYDHPLYQERLAKWWRTATEARTIFMQKRKEMLWLNPVAARSQIQHRLFED